MTAEQQKDLNQRKAVRKRRSNEARKVKLANAGKGAMIGGVGTVAVSSMAAEVFAGLHSPANIILIPLVVPSGIVGGIYGWIKGPRKKLIPIAANDDQIRRIYLQMNQDRESQLVPINLEVNPYRPPETEPEPREEKKTFLRPFINKARRVAILGTLLSAPSITAATVSAEYLDEKPISVSGFAKHLVDWSSRLSPLGYVVAFLAEFAGRKPTKKEEETKPLQ